MKSRISLNRNVAYILLPCGIGDTVMMCSFYNELKRKYKMDITYLIKSSHKVILDMYNNPNYITVDVDQILKTEENNISNEIKQGAIYIGHPTYHDELDAMRKFDRFEYDFYELYVKFLGVEGKIEFIPPSKRIDVKNETLAKINCTDVSDIVLYAPDMNSYPRKKALYDYFDKQINFAKDSEKLIVNMVLEDERFEKYRVDLSLEELVAICINCKKVVSARSGLCDLIYHLVNEMHVLYPSEDYYRYYNMNALYGDRACVTEEVFDFVELLRSEGYHNCALYGYGKNGKEIKRFLEKRDYDIKYIIDRNKEVIAEDYVVYHSLDNLPRAEVIVITIMANANAIAEEIRAQCDIPVYVIWS